MSTQSHRPDLVPEKIGGLAALARVAEENGKASVNDLTFRDMDDGQLKGYLGDFEEFAGEETRIKIAYMMEETSTKVQEIAKLALKRRAYTLVKAEIEKRAGWARANKLEKQEAKSEESEDTKGSSDEETEDGESSEDTNDDKSSERISDKDVAEDNSAAKEDCDKKEEKKPWEVPLTARQVASAELAKKIRHFASNEDAQESIPTDVHQRKAIWEQLETNPLLVSSSKSSSKKGRIFESSADVKYRFNIKETTIVTNFSLRIEGQEDVKGLKKFMTSEKAQTYLTQPPLPINLHLLLASDYPVNNVTIQCELKPCFVSKLASTALQLTNIAIQQFPSSKKTMKWSDTLMKLESDEDTEVLEQFVGLFNRMPSFTRDAVYVASIATTEPPSAAESEVASTGEQDEEADIFTTTTSPEEAQKKTAEALVGKKSKKTKKDKKSQTGHITASNVVDTPSENKSEASTAKKSKKSKKGKKAKADTKTTIDTTEAPREEEAEPSAQPDVAQRCVVN